MLNGKKTYLQVADWLSNGPKDQPCPLDFAIVKFDLVDYGYDAGDSDDSDDDLIVIVDKTDLAIRERGTQRDSEEEREVPEQHGRWISYPHNSLAGIAGTSKRSHPGTELLHKRWNSAAIGR
jgi:hypothetical protein